MYTSYLCHWNLVRILIFDKYPDNLHFINNIVFDQWSSFLNIFISDDKLKHIITFKMFFTNWRVSIWCWTGNIGPFSWSSSIRPPTGRRCVFADILFLWNIAPFRFSIRTKKWNLNLLSISKNDSRFLKIYSISYKYILHFGYYTLYSCLV